MGFPGYVLDYLMIHEIFIESGNLGASMVELGVNDTEQGQGYLWNDKCKRTKILPVCFDHTKKIFHWRLLNLESLLKALSGGGSFLTISIKV